MTTINLANWGGQAWEAMATKEQLAWVGWLKNGKTTMWITTTMIYNNMTWMARRKTTMEEKHGHAMNISTKAIDTNTITRTRTINTSMMAMNRNAKAMINRKVNMHMNNTKTIIVKTKVINMTNKSMIMRRKMININTKMIKEKVKTMINMKMKMMIKKIMIFLAKKKGIMKKNRQSTPTKTLLLGGNEGVNH